MYVEGNPLKYTDPYGFEKYIILYGSYDDTESFYAAAYTQQQKALAAGYNEDDILLREISTDVEILDAIAQSDENEIEYLYIMAHGWGEEGGGLQLNTGRYKWKDFSQFTAEDLDSSLQNRFSRDAEFHIQACEVGTSSLPQKIADELDVITYASTRNMKFWKLQRKTGGWWILSKWKDVAPGENVNGAETRWSEYDKESYNEKVHVEMKPYKGKWIFSRVDEGAYVPFIPL